jgi:hypothetical protein
MRNLLIIFFIYGVISCKKETLSESNTSFQSAHDSVIVHNNNYFDLPADSAPRFVNVSYIDLNKITRISRFRSGIGHDYSDDFEFCRSMKHYFDPGIYQNDTIRIYSPVKGKVVRMFSEWAGNQIQIQSTDYPAFTFILFHVNSFPFVLENADLEPGQLIGYHIGNMTMSDIAVKVNSSVNGPKADSVSQSGQRLFSIFQLMSDSLFQIFQMKGIPSRNDMLISEAERNNDPLDCNGEVFHNEGTLQNWIVLP